MLCYVLYSIGVPIQGDCINSYEDPAVVEPITSQVSDQSVCVAAVLLGAGCYLEQTWTPTQETGDRRQAGSKKKEENEKFQNILIFPKFPPLFHCLAIFSREFFLDD